MITSAIEPKQHVGLSLLSLAWPVVISTLFTNFVSGFVRTALVLPVFLLTSVLLPSLIMLAAVTPAHADIFKPAYLQIKQVDDSHYDIMWKIPALDDRTPMKVKPVFPKQVEEVSNRRSTYLNGSMVQRWRINVPLGLEGHTIGFTGLDKSNLEVLVRFERSDASEQLSRILSIDPTFVPQKSAGSSEVVKTYTGLGIHHILVGIDHLLFVLALVLIVSGTKRLLITITTFTLAHSITLALATLNIVSVPGPPVEAIIALSIMFVAIEILRLEQGKRSLAAEKPWLIAFSFGLLHGLGFAGALAEVGLPQNAIPLALLFFNVGVEIGQLIFIAVVLLTLHILSRFLSPQGMQSVKRFITYAIGIMASFWVIERVVAFWS